MKKIMRDEKHIDAFIDWLVSADIPESGLQVEVKEYEPQRSLSQNALFWLWMAHLVDKQVAGDITITKEDWHDYFVHRFLGWKETRYIGNTMINPTLKHTSDLLRKPMTEFMYKIEVFCAERNIYLPIPDDALYLKYREADFGQVA